MAERIFSLSNDGTLQPLQVTHYALEEELQQLLAEHHDLLAGDQIDTRTPRRFLLVRREQGVSDGSGPGGRWSVDHLFLDQDAVPTLVEVKRSTDTRIRREVVGQMLDYAANAVVYWPIEQIRATFEARCEAQGDDPATIISEVLKLEPDQTAIETFWMRAKENLQAGKIRMMFVADAIPPELRRVVEFLNEQMDPAEVLALEIKQFVGQHGRTLVPSLVGRTMKADLRKTGREPGEAWTRERWMARLADHGHDAVDVANRLFDWSTRTFTRITWGRSPEMGSFTPVLDIPARFDRPAQSVWVFSVWTYGRIEMQFQWLKGRPGFDTVDERQALIQDLNQIPGISISLDAHSRRPSFPISTLAPPSSFERFQSVVQSVLDTVRAAHGRQGRTEP